VSTFPRTRRSSITRCRCARTRLLLSAPADARRARATAFAAAEKNAPPNFGPALAVGERPGALSGLVHALARPLALSAHAVAPDINIPRRRWALRSERGPPPRAAGQALRLQGGAQWHGLFLSGGSCPPMPRRGAAGLPAAHARRLSGGDEAAGRHRRGAAQPAGAAAPTRASGICGAAEVCTQRARGGGCGPVDPDGC
jgi:hypothetical protein